MGRKASDGWFSVSLDEPYILTPDPSPSSLEPVSVPHQVRLNGAIILRLTKPTKVKSLSLTFSGHARTTFFFDSSNIPGAKPCVSIDKHHYGCTLTEQKETLLSCMASDMHLLPVGTHRLPFSFAINERLPAVVSSVPIAVHYQVIASLQLGSLLPFVSPHHIIKPVILLQRDELPSDDMFSTTVIRVKSKDTERLSSHISIPCSVFPQGGIIPLTLNLSLRGNATTATKVTIELIESIYARPHGASGPQSDILIDERLVTRQNCPVHDWPSSTTEEPVLVPKRLMFKVPQLPLSAWSKDDAIAMSNVRPSLDKGFCHASGMYTNSNVRIAHFLRVLVQVRGLSSDAGSTIEHDSGENEARVWIVGNQEYKDDEMNPPSYYRSFSTKLVEGDKIHEIDQLAIEALQDELPESVVPPCYEDSCVGSSARTSPMLTSWPNHSQTSLDQFSLIESLGESATSAVSHDAYAHDLAAYTQRYSYANAAVLAI
ncbi:hypothetical protein BC939DRAFT_437531 [Gamsiella multidivaricata]|uniref:uncharacterized protein n=1 Tax=Gamsiella multidivaricata TaxID=101098 RepID=UPI00221E7C5B|nr:uncharacterized protein BC939DRAFT_437531 [Gamsiella multidivaricata]KAG0371034.1 hypothetical protein BGZ54_001388 [Gamsiella multidivaricata]KAI7831600.1 hypothetical protein BC939DRAFT_437531 [Gamsiella multidivaricata]